MSSQPSQVRPGSVSRDWRRPLTSEKSEAYVNYLQSLESAHGMFSVSLDEALGLQKVGRSSHAQQMLRLSPALCRRLSSPLKCLLGTMSVHARHFGIAPNLVPLNPGNFQSPRSQWVARFNGLFSKVLLTKKSQFVNKISTLEDLVGDLHDNFVSTAAELLEDEPVQPERDWERLDAVHYDLNTCFRETVVLYKSFLHALPDGQLADFQSTLQSRHEAAQERVAARAWHLTHRRIAFLKGQ